MAYIHKDDITIGEPLHTNFLLILENLQQFKKIPSPPGLHHAEQPGLMIPNMNGGSDDLSHSYCSSKLKSELVQKILGVTKMHSYDGFYCQNMTYIKFKHNGYVLTL